VASCHRAYPYRGLGYDDRGQRPQIRRRREVVIDYATARKSRRVHCRIHSGRRRLRGIPQGYLKQAYDTSPAGRCASRTKCKLDSAEPHAFLGFETQGVIPDSSRWRRALAMAVRSRRSSPRRDRSIVADHSNLPVNVVSDEVGGFESSRRRSHWRNIRSHRWLEPRLPGAI